jgi:outer membrane protein TolC
MKSRRIIQAFAALFAILGCFSACAKPLTLTEAEHLAINTSPELQRFQANSHALQQQAIADGQLQDPQLVAGVANLPTNSFSFTQEDMTMEPLGLQQTFARGHSLLMKSRQTNALASAEQKKSQEQVLTLLRNVRETWFDLYYWTHAIHVLRNNQLLYRNLLKVSESQYSVGKVNQSDVIQIQLELSKLNDQIIQAEQERNVLIAQLGRWIGDNHASRHLALSLPSWPNPPPPNRMRILIQQHPILTIDAANIEAARHEVGYAKEQYKPGWNLNVGYAKRQGNFPDGSRRSDFVAAQVTVDLPFFTANRQDRQLSASYHRLAATKLEQQTHYRDLLQVVNTQYAIWKRLSQRESLYKNELIPEAKQNANAALLAYQNSSTDLTPVLRAYINEINIQLEQLQIQVQRAKSRVTLLYYEGIPV